MELELDTHSKGKALKVKGKVAVKLAMPDFLPRPRQAEPENSTLVLHGEASRQGPRSSSSSSRTCASQLLFPVPASAPAPPPPCVTQTSKSIHLILLDTAWFSHRHTSQSNLLEPWFVLVGKNLPRRTDVNLVPSASIPSYHGNESQGGKTWLGLEKTEL